jgi:hypothetical protein
MQKGVNSCLKEQNIFLKKSLFPKKIFVYICTHKNAEVAQLVELQPSKLVVASSSLVFRAKNLMKF